MTSDERQETIDRFAAELATLAEERGIPDDTFDDMVYDLAGELNLDELNTIEDEDDQEEFISGFEHDASDINNGGFESQLRFLLGGYSAPAEGAAELRRMIEEAAEDD